MNFMLMGMPRSASAFIIVSGSEVAAVYHGDVAEACVDYAMAAIL